MGAKGRQAKGKARLSAYDKLQNEEAREKEAKLELFIPPGDRLGDKVIELNDVTKAYGNRVLIDHFTCSIPKNAIVGIIGPNGVGKSTLFRMIMGNEKQDSGTITIGDTVHLSYVDQSHADLKPELTVMEAVGKGQELIMVGKTQVNVRAYLSKFNISGSDQQKNRHTFRRRTQQGSSGYDSQGRSVMSCYSTNQPMILISIRCALWKKPLRILQDVYLLYRTTDGLLTGWLLIYLLLKMTLRSYFLKVTSVIMKRPRLKDSEM